MGKIESDCTDEDDATERTRRKLIPVARVHSRFQSLDSVEVEAVEMKGRMPILPLPQATTSTSSRFVEERDPHETYYDDRDETEERGQPEETSEHRTATSPKAECLETQLSMYPYTEDLKNFDLMNITITIYGITGIMCEQKPVKKSKRRSSLKPSRSKESDSSKSQSNEEPSENIFVIPTTVAASVKRNAISSQTVIETFYPSKPLKIKSTPGIATNLSAVWQTPIPTLGLCSRQDEDNYPDPQSSFQLIRMMMKKPYSRAQVLVENYIHEQVQIGINLCRGGELMRLGVATLIITGEEEGQVMMHVPTRPVSNAGIQYKKHTSRARKKEIKKNKFSFQNDDKVYRLDENASLYLGVQVNPQRDVEAAERFDEDIEASDSELLSAAHAAKETLMRLREYQDPEKIDEDWEPPQTSFPIASGINDASSTRSKKDVSASSRKPLASKEATATTEVGMPSSFVPESMLSGMFCGAIPMLSANKNNLTATGNRKISSENKSNNSNCPRSGEQANSNGNLNSDFAPISEVLNVKYAPAYAKSFFSAVTYSYTNTDVTMGTDGEGDQDDSDLLEQSTQHFALR
jgi:hypothetical protein